jgi:hypothetical protein
MERIPPVSPTAGNALSLVRTPERGCLMHARSARGENAPALVRTPERHCLYHLAANRMDPGFARPELRVLSGTSTVFYDPLLCKRWFAHTLSA